MNTKGKSIPTDGEIKELMNFEELIAAYKKATPKTSHGLALLRWVIGASTVLVFSLSLYFSLKPNESKVQQKEQMIRKEPIESPPPETITSPNNLAKQSITPKPAVTAKKEKKVINSEVEMVALTPEYLAAEPIDGYPSLYSYFDRELKYPMQLTKDSIQGVESVAFVIDKNGKPVKIEIQQSLGAAFDKEVIRLIESMPPWKPATLNGEPILSKISIPFTFRIKSNQ